MLYLLFMLPAIAIALWAQSNIQNTYKKFSQLRSTRGMSGAELARYLLDRNGLVGMPVTADTDNALENYYDPRNKSMHLSPQVAQDNSVAALGIVAHEVGHALQDAQQYAPMKLRSALVPAAQLGSNLAFVLILAGIFMNVLGLLWLGIAAFAVGTAFAVATLPVELDASRRANVMLADNGILVTEEEQIGARKVLGAAAWTYIAAIIASVATLLYYLSIASRGR